MAMVDVGHVRMRVDEFVVSMDVLVTTADVGVVRVVVVVVTVVVDVLVIVVDRGMHVVVVVVAAQHEPNAETGDRDRAEFACRQGLAQHGPCDDRSDEGSRCEHELAASGTELAGTGDPSRNNVAATIVVKTSSSDAAPGR